METRPKHTPWQVGGGSTSGITHADLIDLGVKSEVRRLLAPLPNPTDLKCDVWENAVATRSPELLLIGPIRGETGDGYT